MSYKYYNIRPKPTPKEFYQDHYSATYEALVSNAPNYFDNIYYEKDYGEKNFFKTAGRVDSVIDPVTQRTLGDDYKRFILAPSDPRVQIGKLFKWEDNYWLTVNANTYESLVNSCIVKRCNNVLKWIDKDGVAREEPCSTGYDVFQPRDYQAKDFRLISGQITLQCQKNAFTNYIKENQRFIFGTKENRRAYKVFGDGVVNYVNTITEDDYSPSVLAVYLGGDYINSQTDDLENGIADAFEKEYTIEIDQGDVFQEIGFQTTLTATVKRNGVVVTEEVLWSSSNASVCSINSNGNIEILDVGTSIITVKLKKNPVVFSSVEVKGQEFPVSDYEIRIAPSDPNIYEKTEKTYVTTLYLNDIALADAFSFEVVSVGIPSYKYDFTVLNDNTFKIKNNRMNPETNLVVRCTSGTHVRDFEFSLKGVF
jgi:hypothetical protein